MNPFEHFRQISYTTARESYLYHKKMYEMCKEAVEDMKNHAVLSRDTHYHRIYMRMKNHEKHAKINHAKAEHILGVK